MEGLGRGRGRGGVPLLPEGMWESLNGDSRSKSFDADFGELEDKQIGGESDITNSVQDNGQFEETNDMPVSFGKIGNEGRGFVKNKKGIDWDCGSCGNQNWSWRTSCNKCGSSKPSSHRSQAEIRDGIGGGFNERQDRVAHQAVEVGEDGFDDFGRRVQDRNKNKRDKEAAALARLRQSYGFLYQQNMEDESGDKDIHQIAGKSSDSNNRNNNANSGHGDEDRGRSDKYIGNNKNKTLERTSANERDGERSRYRDHDRDHHRDRDYGRERDRNRNRSRDRERSRDRNSSKDYDSVGDSSRKRERDRDPHTSGRRY